MKACTPGIPATVEKSSRRAPTPVAVHSFAWLANVPLNCRSPAGVWPSPSATASNCVSAGSTRSAGHIGAGSQATKLPKEARAAAMTSGSVSVRRCCDACPLLPALMVADCARGFSAAATARAFWAMTQDEWPGGSRSASPQDRRAGVRDELRSLQRYRCTRAPLALRRSLEEQVPKRKLRCQISGQGVRKRNTRCHSTVCLEGLEPPTSTFVALRSIQLSYRHSRRLKFSIAP